MNAAIVDASSYAFVDHDRDTALYLLEAIGVKEVDLWLRPEVQFWDTGLAGNLEPQDVLRKKATDWLELWTYQYKVNRVTHGIRAEVSKSSPVGQIRPAN